MTSITANMEARCVYTIEIDSDSDWNKLSWVRRDFEPEAIAVTDDIRQVPNFIHNIDAFDRLRIIIAVVSPHLELLPKSNEDLEKFKYLIIGSSRLQSLPESIGNLKNLDTLWIASTTLESLPQSIGNLKNLERLCLFAPSLRSIPNSIGNLELLQIMEVFDSNIAVLPNSIENLTSLFFFTIKSSRLESIPDCIEKMTHLEFFLVEATKLALIPDTIGNLPSLKSLHISAGADLTRLPAAIGNLQLEGLSFTNTMNLRTLPESFASLVKLENLYLSGSGIVSSSLRIESETNKTIILQLPSLQKCKGVRDPDVFRSLLLNSAKPNIFHEGLSEPPLSLWPSILAKGEAALGTGNAVYDLREELSEADGGHVDANAIQSEAIFVLLKYYGNKIFAGGKNEAHDGTIDTASERSIEADLIEE